MVGVIGSLLDIDLEYHSAVLGGVLLTGGDDVVEGVSQTVEGVEDTRAHLAVHVCRRSGIGVVLQGTRRHGIDQVGMHDVQTPHNVFFIYVDGVVLIDRTGADLDEVIILGDEFVASPSIAALLARSFPTQTAHAGNVDGVEGREGSEGEFPVVVGHTGA